MSTPLPPLSSVQASTSDRGIVLRPASPMLTHARSKSPTRLHRSSSDPSTPASLAAKQHTHFIDDSHLPHVCATLSSHELELRELIARGGFASVYLTWHTRYQQFLAVKIATLGEESWSGELDSLLQLSHHAIVQLYDAFQDDLYSYLVLEYCAGGSLEARMKRRHCAGFKEFRDVAVRLLDGLGYCHSVGIAHLDIKPENILFGGDGRARLADFGCSRRSGRNFFGGSLPFMAPEILAMMGDFNPFQADVWSLGVTLYYLAAGRLPWGLLDTKGMTGQIRLAKFLPLGGVDPRIALLIGKMLKLEPHVRATTKVLLEMVSAWTHGKAVVILSSVTGLRGRMQARPAVIAGCRTSRTFVGLESVSMLEFEDGDDVEKMEH